ncbi:MAG: FKBP-type peptidyl-prolyl cis-trans isomerase [Bacteroidia bacterium]
MNALKSLPILILLLSGVVLSSCSKEQLEKDTNKIEKYLKKNDLTAEKTDDGIYYIIDVIGAGDHPKITDEVKVHYRGYTLKDDVFDSSYDRGEPSSFPLDRVIEGWQLGIPLFKEGGKGKLFIPSELGYGNNPPPFSGIGVDEVLIFDVELIEIL